MLTLLYMSMLAHAMHNGPQVLMSRQGFTESDGQPGLQQTLIDPL